MHKIHFGYSKNAAVNTAAFFYCFIYRYKRPVSLKCLQ